MFNAKRSLATLAVVAGLLAAAAPASAGDPPARTPNVICAFPDVCKTAVVYNGHAGLNAPT